MQLYYGPSDESLIQCSEKIAVIAGRCMVLGPDMDLVLNFWFSTSEHT